MHGLGTRLGHFHFCNFGYYGTPNATKISENRLANSENRLSCLQNRLANSENRLSCLQNRLPNSIIVFAKSICHVCKIDCRVCKIDCRVCKISRIVFNRGFRFRHCQRVGVPFPSIIT